MKIKCKLRAFKLLISIRTSLLMNKYFYELVRNSNNFDFFFINSFFPSSTSSSLLPIYPVHQVSRGRNIAKGKLYLWGLNHECTREESARNEGLDKRYVEKKRAVSHADTRDMLVEFERMSREKITRISLNLHEQETPRAVSNDVSLTLMVSAIR